MLGAWDSVGEEFGFLGRIGMHVCIPAGEKAGQLQENEAWETVESKKKE